MPLNNVLQFQRRINWANAGAAIAQANLYAGMTKRTSWAAFVRGVDKATGKMLYGVCNAHDAAHLKPEKNPIIYHTIAYQQ